MTHAQQLQACLSPFGFNDGTQRSFLLQNELAKRENERKTSMSFGYGGSFFTNQSPAMNPMMPTSMMPLQLSTSALNMQDEGNSFNYYMGGAPF